MSEKQLVVNLSLKSSSFDKQIKNINNETKLLKSQFEKAGAGVKDFDKTIEGQTAKMKLLQGTYDNTQKKLEVYRQKQEKATETLNKATDAYSKAEKEVDRLSKELQDAEKTYGKNSDQVKKLKEELKAAEDAFKKKSDSVTSANNSLVTLNTTINKTETEAQKLKSEMNDLSGEITSVNSSVSSGNFTELGNNMDEAGQKAENFGAKMSIVGQGMIDVGEKALDTGKKILTGMGGLVEAGADAEEMQSKFDTVFGDMSNSVEEWASTYSDAVGRNKYNLMEFVSNQADLAIGMGMSKDKATDLSKSYAQLALDLGSFNNVSDERAFEAIGKAMMGETEMMKSLGVNLSVATMENSAYVKSLGKKWSAMTQAEKAEAYYAEMIKQSTNAIGDAERTADSYTNQMRGLKATKEEIAVTLGSMLIPVLTPLVGIIKDIVGWLASWVEANPELARVIMIVVGAIGALLAIFGAVMIPLGMATIAMGAFGTVSFASLAPVLAVIGGIAALIAILAALYVNWDKITSFLSNAWDSCVTNIQEGLATWLDDFVTAAKDITDLLGNLSGFFRDIGWEWMADLLDGLKAMWENITRWVSDSVTWLISKLQFWKKGTDTMSTPQSGAMPMTMQPQTMDLEATTFGLDNVALSGSYYQPTTFASTELNDYIKVANGVPTGSTNLLGNNSNMDVLFDQFATKIIGAIGNMNINVATTNVIGNREIASIMTDSVVKTIQRETRIRR